MNITVIVVNPSKDSFSKSIMKKVEDNLKENEKSYEMIDLYEENFNTVMSEEDVKFYSKGEINDPLVKKYQNILKETDTKYMVEELDNPIEATFVKEILNASGMTDVKWINKNLAETVEEGKNRFLDNIASHL